jgi:GAF domain-containing protein
MRLSRTFGFRIAFGFSLLIIAIIINTVISHRIVAKIRDTQQEVTEILNPSIRALSEFRSIILQTKDDLQSWEFSGRNTESPTLNDVRSLLQTKMPESHQQISDLSSRWDQEDREAYENLYSFINDSLFTQISRFIGSLYQMSGSDSLFTPADLPMLLNSYRFTDIQLLDLIRKFDQEAQEADQVIQSTYSTSGRIILINGIVIALAAILIAILLFYSIFNPIKKYRNTIASVGMGILPEEKFREGKDELGRIGSALNRLIHGLKNLTTFSEEMGKGNFKSDFKPLSDGDTLGNSLIQLRENLKTATIEEEKRKREDERRNWSNQGIARFSEILREHTDDLDKLASKLISELVKYLGAQVGGLFLIQSGDKDEKVIELVSSYAYDRVKHLQKSIQVGEGLVGRCVQEGNTIFLTDIPEDYIRIKSGLGEDNPRCLLIVPLRLNEEITGVIEIATLEVFEEFQIEFIERIGTSIASSISAAFADELKRIKT